MSTPISLTAPEQKQLRLQTRRSVGRVSERIHYVLLFSRGHPPDQIAALYEVDERTVQDWLERFRQHGAKGLDDRPRSGRPRLATVAAQIQAKCICLAFPGYGYRRVTAQLHRNGWGVNHKRVLDIMQTESLLCRLQKAFHPPSAGSTKTAYPNLTQQLVVERMDQVWVVDMTYVRLPQGFVYLACVLDAFSRRVIGWHLSREIDTRLTLAALNCAIAARRPQTGLIHHSDRGVQCRKRRLCRPLDRDRRVSQYAPNKTLAVQVVRMIMQRPKVSSRRLRKKRFI